MDYTLNPALFLCLLRDYLAAAAPANLQRLFTGESCADYLRDTRLLLNSLRILLLLEARVAAALLLNPLANVSGLASQQAIVISYCLTLMDGLVVAELPYGLQVSSFDACGLPGKGYRVRAANGKASTANANFINAGPVAASLSF